MAAFDLISLPVVNGADDGVTLDLLANGVAVSEDTTHSDVSNDQFRKDAISVTEAGAVEVTEGTEAADEASAETPDIPADNTLIGVVTITDVGGSETMALELDLGGHNTVSADESHVA